MSEPASGVISGDYPYPAVPYFIADALASPLLHYSPAVLRTHFPPFLMAN